MIAATFAPESILEIVGFYGCCIGNFIIVVGSNRVHKSTIKVCKVIIALLSTKNIMGPINTNRIVNLPYMMMKRCINTFIIVKVFEGEVVFRRGEVKSISHLMPIIVSEDIHIGLGVILKRNKRPFIMDRTWRNVRCWN